MTKKVAQLGKERKMESGTDEGCRGSNSDEAQRRTHQINAQNSCFFFFWTWENLDISFGDRQQLVSLVDSHL